ncbi:MAG: cardiolipin synthase, partial [Planctomycetales bacterium]|nr:cardiolipin synthase [Planctomycetales bacterium]
MVTVHAVLYKRDTRAVIGWVGLAWLAPIVGPLGYFMFGINRIQRRAVALRIRESHRWEPMITLSDDDRVRMEEIDCKYPSLVGLARLGYELTDRHLVPGNRISALLNGDRAFPAMLQAIDSAEKTISLQSYIFDSDEVGERFRQALVRANERGVEIRVLIDDVGSTYSRPTMVRILRRSGIRVAAFLPTFLPRVAAYANLRNHRKILVVDGRVAFTGGTNIRAGHWQSLKPAYPIECIHFRVEGPVVMQLQEAFAIDWAFTTEESLRGDGWFPTLTRVGKTWARGIPDGPDEDFEKITDALTGAICCASRSIRIVTPYFLPHAALTQALNVAAMRGVKVEIVLPGVNNLPYVQWAAVAQYWQLLEKGCRIYHSPPPFDHSKIMVVDGIWSLIGSSNWDPRSLRLNFEYNIECYDTELAQQLIGICDQKMAEATPVTLADVNGRSLPVQLRDGLCRLLTPYL